MLNSFEGLFIMRTAAEGVIRFYVATAAGIEIKTRDILKCK